LYKKYKHYERYSELYINTAKLLEMQQ